MPHLEIRKPEEGEWFAIAELIATTLPTALPSRLGARFGALYYRELARHPLSCCLATFSVEGQLAGIVLATLDRHAARSFSLKFKFRLLLATNVRLFSPQVIRWLLSGIGARILRREKIDHPLVAELVIVGVHEDFRGRRLATRLIDDVETFFKNHRLQTPYLILTEQSNQIANRLYENSGAVLIRTYRYRDKRMNEWHKSL